MMSWLVRFAIPVGTFVLGCAGTYFGLDAYEKRQQDYYSKFYEGLPEIARIDDPNERARQLRKLKRLAETGYRATFFSDVDRLIEEADSDAEAARAVKRERQEQQREEQLEAARKQRVEQARRTAEKAEARLKQQEADRKARKIELLRALEAEKVCQNPPTCSSWILR